MGKKVEDELVLLKKIADGALEFDANAPVAITQFFPLAAKQVFDALADTIKNRKASLHIGVLIEFLELYEVIFGKPLVVGGALYEKLTGEQFNPKDHKKAKMKIFERKGMQPKEIIKNIN